MALDIVVQFVERKLSTEDFIQHLYYNEDVETLLSEKMQKFPTNSHESIFLFLLDQDLTSPRGLLNALGVLEDFLVEKQVPFTKNKEAAQIHSIFSRAQPRWVDLPEWHMKKIWDSADGRTGKELEEFIKATVKRQFRYAKRPPRWLQGPAWLYENEEPLLFVGQMDISEIRHDHAQLYVFTDLATGKFYTVEQAE